MKLELSQSLDEYTRNARLKPALLAILPIAWTVVALWPETVAGWSGLLSIMIACGGTYLLAQLGRGKAKEPELFRRIGGRPTERMLSFAGGKNQIVVQRWHDLLEKLIPGVTLPTQQQEQLQPERARQGYELCTQFLIAQTRNHEHYPLVFQENCNYGFRRNLWALKPVGLAIATVCFGAMLVGLARQHRMFSPFGMAGLDLFDLALWVLCVTPTWVKVAADAYAEKLLQSLYSLEIKAAASAK